MAFTASMSAAVWAGPDMASGAATVMLGKPAFGLAESLLARSVCVRPGYLASYATSGTRGDRCGKARTQGRPAAGVRFVWWWSVRSSATRSTGRYRTG